MLTAALDTQNIGTPPTGTRHYQQAFRHQFMSRVFEMPPLLARSRQANQLLVKRLDGERKRTIDRRRGVIHDSPL